MGSIRSDGVRYVSYSMDHEPRHVHGFYAEIEVIVDLRADGKVSLANRTDAILPSNGSKSDVRHVLAVAAAHFDELVLFGRSTMAEHKVITTDAEIHNALERARLHDGDPVAVKVEHVADLKLLIVTLSNRRRLVLPIEDLQGLRDATDQQLRHHELLGRGTGISFPALDVDLYVPALIEGVYGNRHWMARLGRKGGKSTTEAKRRAAKANGAKGGRPARSVATHA
jgi:Protein of unknown function (DUF2442)/Domain of unknown function (DUF4160)